MQRQVDSFQKWVLIWLSINQCDGSVTLSLMDVIAFWRRIRNNDEMSMMMKRVHNFTKKMNPPIFILLLNGLQLPNL